MLKPLLARGTHMEATCAFVAAVFLLVNFVVYVIAALARFFDANAGIWWFASVVICLLAACAYTRIFFVGSPWLCSVSLVLIFLATAFYLHELFTFGPGIGDLPNAHLPVRYSQILLPLSYLLLGVVFGGIAVRLPIWRCSCG